MDRSGITAAEVATATLFRNLRSLVIIFVLTPNLDMYPLKLRFEIARISLRNGAVAQCSQIHHTHFHAYYYNIITLLLLLFDMCTLYYCRIRSETRLFAPIYRPTLNFVDLLSLLFLSTNPVRTHIVL